MLTPRGARNTVLSLITVIAASTRSNQPRLTPETFESFPDIVSFALPIWSLMSSGKRSHGLALFVCGTGSSQPWHLCITCINYT